MPTYDYRCDACGHEWELFQAISANPVKKCPDCNKSKAKRIIGAGAGVIFKGSGFYQTDYRSSAYKKSAEADKKAGESSNGSGSESKSSEGKSSSKSESTTSAD